MISILIPTCHRPDLLSNMLRSLSKTTFDTWQNIEVIVVIDEDRDSFRLVYDWATAVFPQKTHIDFDSKKRGALWAWNKALQLSSGNIIVPAGDDQVFHEGWLDYALESHKEQLDGYGVVGMNDLAYNGNTQVATMFLFDREYCKKEMGGIFAPPMYKYYCIDSEWNEKAKMLGKFYWDERSKVEHLHSAHGKRPYDDHDALKLDNAWSETDTKTFEERKARGFPIEWQPII